MRADYDVVEQALAAYAEDSLSSDTAKVHGTVLHAIAALGYSEAEVTPLGLPDALERIARSVAFGVGGRGSGLLWPGRRRGWMILRALGGVAPHAQVDPDVIGAAGSRVLWFGFFAEHEDEEHSPRRFLAIEDPTSGLAWAMAAADSWD